MRTFANLLLASSLPLSALAAATDLPPSSFANLQVSAKQCYRFPDGTYIENIAVQPNNVLILTSTTTNKVFLYDPATCGTGTVPSVALGLPGVTGALGIAEVYPNQYLIAGGDVSNGPPLSQSNQTFFLVDFAARASYCDGADGGAYHDGRPGGVGCAQTAKLVKVLPGRPPANSFPNGVAALGKSCPGVALVADSALGVLYRVDAQAGTVEQVFSDPALAPGPGDLSPATLGVNGLKVRDGYVYFTNTYTGVLGRARVSSDGRLFGKVEIISQLPQDKGFDDFAIQKDACVVYATVHSGLLVAIEPNGPSQEVIVGPGGKTQQVELDFPTSAAFARQGYGSKNGPYAYGSGKAKQATDTLYVVTGGIASNGSEVGGQIVQVLLRNY